MAPLFQHLLPRKLNPEVSSEEFKDQWTHPGDVFVVLLILGGDVVGRALAQLAGSRVTPVALSFGWVSYAISAVVSAFGENKLMPLPDCACLVINGRNGYIRENSSWVIGRIMRDYESWMDSRIKTKLRDIITENHTTGRQEEDENPPNLRAQLRRPSRPGLCVSVYTAGTAKVGYPGYSFVYWTGIGTVIIQLGIAAIPCGLFGDWSFFLITICGNILALMTGMLTQWKKEKWACRTESKKTVILTRGNGSQHAIIIIGNGVGLDLEDLATGASDDRFSASWVNRGSLSGLAVLWVIFLITAAGIERKTWFLLAIGALGIVQNMMAAGFARETRDFGVPLTYTTVIGHPKVMDTLFEVEEKYRHTGRSMLETFFPGDRREEETNRWNLLKTLANALDKADDDQGEAAKATQAAKIATREAGEAQQVMLGGKEEEETAEDEWEKARLVSEQRQTAVDKAQSDLAVAEVAEAETSADDEAARETAAATTLAKRIQVTRAENARAEAATRSNTANIQLHIARQAVQDQQANYQTANTEAIERETDAQNKRMTADGSRVAADQARTAAFAAPGRKVAVVATNPPNLSAVAPAIVPAVVPNAALGAGPAPGTTERALAKRKTT